MQHRLPEKLEDLRDLVRAFHKSIAQEDAKRREMNRPGHYDNKSVLKGKQKVHVEEGKEQEARKQFFEAMLQQTPRVTAEMAKAISNL